MNQSANILARRVFQRDVTSGNPSGFATGWNKGWGAVGISITATQASTGLYARLYDADSGGATVTVGTGTLLQASVIVASNIATGTSNITINLPAGPRFYFLDLALDGSFTYPTRIPVPFGVGALTGIMTRSFGSMMVSTYDYYSPMPDPNTVVTVPVNAGASFAVNDDRYGPVAGSTWVPPAGYGTPGGMEYIRLMYNQLGVVHGIFGIGAFGGDLEQWMPGGTGYTNFVSNLAPQAGCKFRYFYLAVTGGAYSRSQWYRALTNTIAGIQSVSSIPVLSIIDGVGFVVGNGTQHDGYTHIGLGTANQLLTAQPTSVVAADVFDMNVGVNGHSSFQGRVRMVRQYYRRLMAVETVTNGGFGGGTGPKFVSALRAAGSNVVQVAFRHDGGSILTGYSVNEPPYSSGSTVDRGCTFLVPPKTSRDYVPAFAMYFAGQNHDDPAIELDTVAGITIDNVHGVVSVPLYQPSAGMIQTTDGATHALTDATALNVVYGADYNGTCPSGANMALLSDERIGTDGIPYGWGMRTTPDGLYVPAPVPPAQSLTIAALTNVIANALTLVSGTGTGLALSSLMLSCNGGAPFTPMGLLIGQDNTWSAYVQMPGVSSGNTLSVYRPGQTVPDATTPAFAIVSRATSLLSAGLSAAATSSLIESWVAPSGVFQDRAMPELG